MHCSMFYCQFLLAHVILILFSGEHMTEEEVAECFAALLTLNDETEEEEEEEEEGPSESKSM